MRLDVGVAVGDAVGLAVGVAMGVVASVAARGCRRSCHCIQCRVETPVLACRETCQLPWGVPWSSGGACRGVSRFMRWQSSRGTPRQMPWAVIGCHGMAAACRGHCHGNATACQQNLKQCISLARPGPSLAPWCIGGPAACPAGESVRNDPRATEAKVQMSDNNDFTK